MNAKKNILFIAFIVMVGLISLPVMYEISNRILEQTKRNNIYSLINKAKTLSSSNKTINIYQVKDNKIINIITNEQKEYQDNQEGYIIAKGDSIAFSLGEKDECITKDFDDNDIKKTESCDKLTIADDIFNIKIKTIKVKDINNIPELEIPNIEEITSTYKIYDTYNNEMVKENIKNNGTYKIVYTIMHNDIELFKKEYKLIFKK